MASGRKFVAELAARHVASGRPTGWFEPLYAAASGDAGRIPWADLAPNPGLLAWAARQGTVPSKGARALVVGCGLGDDAEEMARWGAEVVAFDISATAVEWAKRRFPGSRVHYEAADLLDTPAAWARAFTFVFEAYTLQSIPQSMRPMAIGRVANFVAPGGTLLVIARGRDEREDVEGPPWPLAASELEPFEAAGLETVRFEDYMDEESPPQRRFRVQYERPRSGAS
jgi:2-polyprenyl-3-methyl-5-hydroxy-6-metoxy-1,4-benzoquinol methylase